jgi:hypothetical protein
MPMERIRVLENEARRDRSTNAAIWTLAWVCAFALWAAFAWLTVDVQKGFADAAEDRRTIRVEAAAQRSALENKLAVTPAEVLPQVIELQRLLKENNAMLQTLLADDWKTKVSGR